MKILLAVFCVIAVLGAARRGEASEEADDGMGVVFTDEYEERSGILFYDGELREDGHLTLDVANVRSDANGNEDGGVCLLANGNSNDLDYGSILELDPVSGEIKEYHLGRINLTAYCVDGTRLYALSNLNWVFYIDRLDRADGELRSMEIADRLVCDFAVTGDDVYAVTEDGEQRRVELYRYSFDSGERERLALLAEEGVSDYVDVAAKGDRVYALVDDHFFVYLAGEGKLTEILLEHESASRIYLQEGDVYIVFSDPAIGSERSYIQRFEEAVDGGESEPTGSAPAEAADGGAGVLRGTPAVSYDGTILQLAIRDDLYYIQDYETISILRNEGGELVGSRKIELSSDYDYCGGFFIR